MPRHDPKNTPPEHRRAPKGQVVSRMSGYHTRQSLGALEALQWLWRLSAAETTRRALVHARSCPRNDGGGATLDERIRTLLENPPVPLATALENYRQAERANGRKQRVDSTQAAATHGALLAVGHALAKALEEP